MPSPIAHVAAGYVAYRILRNRLPILAKTLPVFVLFAAVVVLSLLPDCDCVVGIVAGDFARCHNNITHSFAAGIAVAVLVAMGMALAKGREAIQAWFLFGFALYGLHVAMDYLTVGRGVMALWPFLPDRFESPVCLFRGVKWSWGLWSIEHLWTLLNESLFVGVLVLLASLMRRRRRAEAKN